MATQSTRLTDEIRSYVLRGYVQPARSAGRLNLVVPVRDVRAAFSKVRSMTGQSSTICQALQSAKLLHESKMSVVRIDGPPSKKSPTVVMHYRLLKDAKSNASVSEPGTGASESPEARAERLGGQLRGLLKVEIQARGGGEAFLEWVRSDPSDVR